MRQSNLDDNQPALKDSSTGDVVDFYGPCDENPVEKIKSKRRESRTSIAWRTITLIKGVVRDGAWGGRDALPCAFCCYCQAKSLQSRFNFSCPITFWIS